MIQKRFICFFIVLGMMLNSSYNAYASEAYTPPDVPNEMVIDDILDKYHYRCSLTNSSKELEQIQTESIEQLKQYGIEAFSITPSTYFSVEKELNTPLKFLDLNPTDYGIALFDPNMVYSASAPGSYGSTYNYTYNGTTYTMRSLTVTAAFNSSYGVASTADLLNSQTAATIKACLDAALTTAAGALSSTLGLAVTVAQVCGLSFSNFSTAKTSTLSLNCGTNWTSIILHN